MSATDTTESTASPRNRTPAAGQRVRNLLTGETLIFRRTSAESEGELVEMQVGLRPLGSPGGGPHRHLPTERFELTRGTLLVWIAGRPPWVARPGDVIEVPPRRWHFILAISPSHAEVSIRPGMRFDELLASWAEIGSGDLRPSRIRRVVSLLREHGCL